MLKTTAYAIKFPSNKSEIEGFDERADTRSEDGRHLALKTSRTSRTTESSVNEDGRSIGMFICLVVLVSRMDEQGH